MSYVIYRICLPLLPVQLPVLLYLAGQRVGLLVSCGLTKEVYIICIPKSALGQGLVTNVLLILISAD